MYHRVTTLPSDPNLLAVTPENFEAHLEEIRKQCLPLSLRELSESVKSEHIPNRGVVVTFDDGYADNLIEAKPLLERYEIPATVFVAAGQVGRDQEFWWDELERLLLQPGKLPEKLVLNHSEKAASFDITGADFYSDEAHQDNRNWHIECPEDPTARHQLFRQLFDILHPLPDRERRTILGQLGAWAGAGLKERQTHRVLDAAQVRSLAEGGLVEVGAHTLTHTDLTILTHNELQAEIHGSKECLEAILGEPVVSFAYPYGLYPLDAVGTVRDAGMTTACTSNPDAVWARVDPYQMPRVGVRNWDRETFSRWLKWWVDG